MKLFRLRRIRVHLFETFLYISCGLVVFIYQAVNKRRQNKSEDEERYAYAEKSYKAVHDSVLAAADGIRQKRCNDSRCSPDKDKVNEDAYSHFLCVVVLKADNNNSRKEKTYKGGVDKSLLDNIKPHKSQCENYSRKALHKNVSSGNFGAAGAAFSPKKKPAENRYQVIPFDVRPAGHAVRILFGKRFSRGKPENADVKKAAYADAEKEYHNIYSYVVDKQAAVNVRVEHNDLSLNVNLNIRYLYLNIFFRQLQYFYKYNCLKG